MNAAERFLAASRAHDADAAAALIAGNGPITGYFSTAPFTEVALADGRIHKVLSAADVVDGKASFLIMGAPKAYIAAHPKVPEAVAKAMDGAARVIHDDPRRAAEIYLAHEPSKTLDVAGLAAILGDIREKRDLTDDTKKALVAALDAFGKQFA